MVCPNSAVCTGPLRDNSRSADHNADNSAALRNIKTLPQVLLIGNIDLVILLASYATKGLTLSHTGFKGLEFKGVQSALYAGGGAVWRV
jgi:hypothetical protein